MPLSAARGDGSSTVRGPNSPVRQGRVAPSPAYAARGLSGWRQRTATTLQLRLGDEPIAPCQLKAPDTSVFHHGCPSAPLWLLSLLSHRAGVLLTHRPGAAGKTPRDAMRRMEGPDRGPTAERGDKGGEGGRGRESMMSGEGKRAPAAAQLPNCPTTRKGRDVDWKRCKSANLDIIGPNPRPRSRCRLPMARPLSPRRTWQNWERSRRLRPRQSNCASSWP